MAKACILIVFLCACANLQAQPGLMLRENNRPLLQQLQLTQRQRIQLQELVRQQRAQEMINTLRLQQILTPQQWDRLHRFIRRKEIADSINQLRNIPDKNQKQLP